MTSPLFMVWGGAKTTKIAMTSKLFTALENDQACPQKFENGSTEEANHPRDPRETPRDPRETAAPPQGHTN